MAYIEDTNLIEEIKSLKISVGGKDVFPDEAKESVLRVIGEQPIADVVEVKHSEWVMIPVNGVANYRCGNIDCCRLIPFGQMPSDLLYCPYCGAKMDEGNAE